MLVGAEDRLHLGLSKVKVAACQFDVKIFDKARNMKKIFEMIDVATKERAKLAVFPECALQGYVFRSKLEAQHTSEKIPGPSTQKIVAKVKETSMHTVVGMVEKDGEKLYNTAVLIGPDGIIGRFRKVHPWWPAEKPWVTVGNQDFPIFNTKVGKIGMIICKDGRFPEAPRIIALKGAEIITLPTNWTDRIVDYCTSLQTPVRAVENRINIVAANRIGDERGHTFGGHSLIVDTNGKVLAKATGDKEEIIYAILDLQKTSQRIEYLRDRVPTLYKELISTKSNE